MIVERWLVRGHWALATSLLVLTACQPDDRDPVEQVLRNGKILTVDEEFSIVEALAIDGERIVALGSDADIAEHIGPDTQVIDLEGRTVVPGLIDNHMHFIRAVQRWNLQARIDGINSREEALAVISAKASGMEPGEWLMVQGGLARESVR